MPLAWCNPIKVEFRGRRAGEKDGVWISPFSFPRETDAW